jgi:large subunit ribosomal protein L9
MEVILLQDVDKLGSASDLVKVKPGYARNFLIPRRLGVPADETAKKNFAEREKQNARREEKMMMEINRYVDVLKGTTFKVGAKSGTSGKIFGSVTTIQLAAAIKQQKSITVDRKKIALPEDIGTLGTYTATINLHKDVSVPVNFEVVAE